jgi:hypothetical protein
MITVIDEITEILKTYQNMGKMMKFIMAISIRQKMNYAIFKYQRYQQTLQFAMTMPAMHVIPGSNPERESACAPLANLTDPGDSRCMMIKPATGKRCEKIFPKYALTSTNDTIQIVYHVCGHCANKKSTWWSRHYKRVDLTN